VRKKGGEIDEAERAVRGGFERVAWGRTEVKSMKQSERHVAVLSGSAAAEK
jgi:hypothetical protein